ncbi:MAG: FxLYD domain-containing protein [Bifidobacterium crudilactis]|jgi:PBP1b-binding outer membrane lipoprotein LpoB
MKKVGTILLCGVLAVGVSGCSSTSAGNNSASSAPTQTAMTKEEAGKYYLELVKPSNNTIDEYTKAISSQDIPEATKQAGIIVKQYDTAIEKIHAKKWPADAQKYADAVAQDFKNGKPVFEKISKASTYDEINQISVSMKSNGAASSLRKVLGLEAASAITPVTVVSGQFTGDDGYGYLNGTFAVKNDLTVVAKNISVTVSFLDASGNSISETYSGIESIQPGQSANAQWTLETSVTDAVSAKATNVSWSTGDNGEGYQQVSVDGPTVKIR